MPPPDAPETRSNGIGLAKVHGTDMLFPPGWRTGGVIGDRGDSSSGINRSDLPYSVTSNVAAPILGAEITPGMFK